MFIKFTCIFFMNSHKYYTICLFCCFTHYSFNLLNSYSQMFFKFLIFHNIPCSVAKKCVCVHAWVGVHTCVWEWKKILCSTIFLFNLTSRADTTGSYSTYRHTLESTTGHSHRPHPGFHIHVHRKTCWREFTAPTCTHTSKWHLQDKVAIGASMSFWQDFVLVFCLPSLHWFFPASVRAS